MGMRVTLRYVKALGGMTQPRVRGSHLRLSRSRGTTASPIQDVQPFSDIPGPKPLPVVGNVWRFLPVIGPWSGKDFLELQWMLYNEYGKLVKVENLNEGRDMVFLFDPSDIEMVYRKESAWPLRNGFESLDYYRRNMHKEKFEGAHGLLTTNGQEWQDFRRKVQPDMLQPRTVAKYTQPIDSIASELIERLKEIRDDKSVLPGDAINWFFRWALESIATIALDARLGCLAAALPAQSEQQRLIAAVHVLMDSFFQLDVQPSPWRYVATPAWRRYVNALGTFEAIATRYIQEAMDRMKQKVEAGQNLGDNLSVLEKLLISNDNPKIATTMATDMIFGGIDTTAYSAVILLYFLSKNPEKQETLFKELRAILPERDTPVKNEQLQEMKYLRACIKEAMRLKPVVIGQIRVNTSDELVLSNYHVPKGVDMVLLTSVASRLEQFVPDADLFVPERWLKGEDQNARGHPFATLPFGFGPRMCVGKRFAELEIEILSAKILRSFHIEYAEEGKFETNFIYKMTSPLTFKLTDRK